MKLYSSGVRQWHTFYGYSAGSAAGYGIALSQNGQDVVVTGTSDHAWDGLPAPFHAYSGGNDLVVLKLNPLRHS